MKKISDLPAKILGTVAVAAVSFGLLTFSCKANNGSANVAFAETKPVPAASSMQVVESLQDVFRSISTSVLPAVVEVSLPHGGVN